MPPEVPQLNQSIAPPLGHRDGKISLAIADSVAVAMPATLPTLRMKTRFFQFR